MEHDKQDEQLSCAEPRVAAAAALHKRQAVAVGTAVTAGGDGGKPLAGDAVRRTHTVSASILYCETVRSASRVAIKDPRPLSLE
eukprot:2974384-Prymnesium_polylepis.1